MTIKKEQKLATEWVSLNTLRSIIRGFLRDVACEYTYMDEFENIHNTTLIDWYLSIKNDTLSDVREMIKWIVFASNEIDKEIKLIEKKQRETEDYYTYAVVLSINEINITLKSNFESESDAKNWKNINPVWSPHLTVIRCKS